MRPKTTSDAPDVTKAKTLVTGLLLPLCPLPYKYVLVYKVASAEWNRVLRWVDGDPEAMVGDPWKKGTLNRLKDTNIERVNDMLNRRDS